MKKLLARLWWLKYKKAVKPGLKGFEHNCQFCHVDCEPFPCPCKPDEILVKRW